MWPRLSETRMDGDGMRPSERDGPLCRPNSARRVSERLAYVSGIRKPSYASAMPSGKFAFVASCSNS
jgi:hypothetical protein